MAALPWQVRRCTHPVAARDYWGKNKLHRFIAETGRLRGADRPQARSPAAIRWRRSSACSNEGKSILIFPGRHARRRRRGRASFAAAYSGWRSAFPDVELVPVYLDNLRRILPKGSMLPVPITCTARFGTPLHVEPGEDKAAFLERARAAVLALDGAAARMNATPSS